MINTCLHCTIKSVRKYKHPRIIRNHSSLFDPTCSAIIDSNTINNNMAVSNIKSKTRKRQNHRKLSNKLATLSSHTNNESSTLQVNGSLFNPSPSAPFLTLSSLTQPATTTTTTTTAIPTTKPTTIPNTITTTTPTPTTADSIIYDDSITMNEMPRGLRGYYSKRFSLFSLFDKGIQLDHGKRSFPFLFNICANI